MRAEVHVAKARRVGRSDRTFTSDFRKFFGRGLAILLPSIITLWILWQLVVFVYRNVGAPINAGIRLVALEAMPLVVKDPPPTEGAPPKRNFPAWWYVSDARVDAMHTSRHAQGLPEISDARARVLLRRRGFEQWWRQRWYLEATGLLVAIVLIYLAGLLLGNIIGRQLYVKVERLLGRVPIWRHIYPHVKQLIDLLMGEKQTAFRKAVLVQCPRPGMWAVGLVTDEGNKVVKDALGRECITVFIATAPTPFTGYPLVVPREDVVDLPITVDQALRFIITAGVLGFESRVKEPAPTLPQVNMPRDEREVEG